MKKYRFIVEKILVYILIILFSVRLFSFKTVIGDYISLDSSPLSKGITIASLIVIWFDFAIILALMLRPFFNIKITNSIVKYISLPVNVLKLILANNISFLLAGGTNMLLLSLLISESIISIIISCFYLIISFKDKDDYKSILKMIGVFALLLIPSLPSYFVQFMFGFGNTSIIVKEITFYHRVFIYLGVIIPVMIYFFFRNKSFEVRRYTLIYISLATMIGFLVNYDYTTFSRPWDWPFHLCNTAMFILPLCLIFKMKRLFYFTYFINVLGALLAMLMPNYDVFTNVFSMRIFNFWYNHWIAFFMPILAVSLKIFDRPKIKQFYYSMVSFFVYFVLALIMNVIFTAMGKEVDYFFINSTFVADKMGTWAEDLFNMNKIIEIGGLSLEFHPLYQILFFVVYVFLGLAVWFIYNEFFIIADSHYNLMVKLKKSKVKDYLSFNEISNEEKKQIMLKEVEAKLKLDNVSKKYLTSTRYAVKDASFEVYKGEIFGFLGPNGAGKSTIIKSIVGIQPLSEGNIDICGYDISIDPVKAKYHIGYVPDHYALYEKLTGREYINYIADIFEVSKEQREERIERYVKLFELEASFNNKIKTYSHGMKQKITIMAALVHNPKVWILDEPLTGLDPNSIYQVKECMKQHAKEGNIVFFSSHIIDIVEKLCDRIAIIKKGNIKCVKTIKEIEETNNNLEEFYMNIVSSKEEE